MTSIPRLTLLLLALAGLHSCDKSGRQDSSTGNEGDEAAGESPARATVPLTEKRLEAYIAYRKELHGLMKVYLEDVGKLEKRVDEKSNQLTKTIAAGQGVAQILEKQDIAVKTLHKKHGFDEGEDEKLWAAVGDVVAAKAIESPMLEAQVKMFREMQVKGGEEKKNGDEFFKTLETAEKEGLAKAREQYGVEWVDILSKHVKELHALQMDAIQQMTAASTPGK